MKQTKNQIQNHFFSPSLISLFFFLILTFSILTNCSSSQILVDKPNQRKALQRTGFISLYMNSAFYNMANPPADVGGLELIRNDVLLANGGEGRDLSGEETEREAKVSFINEVSQMLHEKLSPHLSQPIISPTKYSTTTEFQKPIKESDFDFGFENDLDIKKNVYLVANGLKLLTFSELIKNVEGDEDLVVGELITVKDLGKFISSIDLDGGWVGEVNVGYRFFRKIDKDRFTLRFSTALKLILVDENGEILFETEDLVAGGGERFESDIVTATHTKDGKDGEDGFLFTKDSKIYSAMLQSVRLAVEDTVNNLQ